MKVRLIAALIIASFIALVALAALFLRSQHKGPEQFADAADVSTVFHDRSNAR